MRKRKLLYRVFAMILCICMVSTSFDSTAKAFDLGSIASGISGLFGADEPTAAAEARSGNATVGAEREADPSTMDTYQKMLDLSKETRYAGRIWSDKTVFANGQDNKDGRFDGTKLTLTPDLDGVDTKTEIPLNEDFLHVYSILGSSQQVNEHVPVDLMVSLDITASMLTNGDGNDRSDWQDSLDATKKPTSAGSNLSKTLNAANQLIDQIRKYSDNSRISIVVYWGTGYQMVPFVDADVQFTGYSVRHDVNGQNNGAGNPEAVLHYTISGKDDGDDKEAFGDYVYDPVFGTHIRYKESKKVPENDQTEQNALLKHDGKLHMAEGGEKVVEADSTNADLGGGTDTEAGIYTALRDIADLGLKGELKYELSNGTKVNRVPAVVILGDGATNHTLVKADDSDYNTPTTGPQQSNKPTIAGKWWAPQEPQKSAQVGENNGAAGVVGGVLQGAYWKAAVANAYGMDVKDVPVFTIGLDAGDTVPVLNPGSFFTKNNATPLTGLQTEDNTGLKHYGDVWNAVETWKLPDGSKDPINIYNVAGNGYDTNPSSMDRDATTYNYNCPTEAEQGEDYKKYKVTPEQLDLVYTNQYFSATGDSIGNIFDEIYQSITQKMFAPVGGVNDLGVDDAITYIDPVGKYMEVKDVDSLVLFGKKHEITKTGVYDYEFNQAYMEAHKGTDPLVTDPDTDAFPRGWYKSTDGTGTTAEPAHFDSNERKNPEGNYARAELPDGCKNAGEARAQGWEFYMDFKTTQQFVNTLEVSDREDMNDKQKQTTYTFYRLADEDRTTLHMNPAYLMREQTEAGALSGKVYDPDGGHLKDPGVYALADLRIWVEDTGDYNDEVIESGGGLSDPNFDRALYINIPVNMLPLRTVAIEQGTSESEGKWTYTTNLDPKNSAYKASFPLRVFYSVGVESSLLTPDGSIDIAAGISQEYIANNKITTEAAEKARGIDQGKLEFFSNWYNTVKRYGSYATVNTDYTYGDPATTFSPSTDNRYYIFEKALPLYKAAYIWTGDDGSTSGEHSGGTWQKVSIDPDTTDEKTATYTPTDFGGKLIAKDLEPADSSNQNIWNALKNQSANKGDIILLKEDRLSDVTKPDNDDPDPFSSDGYYYMPIDYYELDQQNINRKPVNVATSMQYVVTRRGSEFGSAYAASGISNGDMLCWHDVSGKYDEIYPYLSASETKDKTRGKAYIGAELDEDGNYKNTDEKGVPITDGDDGFKKHDEILKQGQWVVSAKPGGLRVGGLAQAVQSKSGNYTDLSRDKDFQSYLKDRYPSGDYDSLTWGYYDGNVTRTANNYYMPTISTSSDAKGGDIIVNTYLGNNGRLTVEDTTLLIDKTVVAGPSGILPDNPDKRFDFQVYIDGYTGAREAVRVRYNENSGTWQRQIHYIDLELDGGLFLQTLDGTRAIVDSNGSRLLSADDGYVYADTNSKYTGTVYNVHIGSPEQEGIGGGNTTLRVYHNPFCETSANETVSTEDITVTYYDADGNKITNGDITENYAGKRDFAATTVTLKPVNGEGDISLNNFYLATLDPNVNEDSSEIAITSPYLTQSAYLTRTIYFGYKAGATTGETGDVIGDRLTQNDLYVPGNSNVDNTAEVTLRYGWGLLFSGMPSGTDYVMAEKISQDDIDEGYSFQSVQHVQQESTTTKSVSEFKGNVYDINGDTGANEEAGHFFNSWSADKTETFINNTDVSQVHDSVKPGVQVGDIITYEVKWANSTGKDATVTITDPLDQGVDFFSADNGGTYDAASHTVTWNLGSQPSGTNGVVTLKVKVNEKAQQYWEYDMTGTPNGTDYRVLNRATVRVGDNEYNTNIVQNPVGGPDKTETNIYHEETNTTVTNDALQSADDGKYHGPVVFAGDQITYQISWRNYKSESATVKITDPLDKNVRFISAKIGDVELLADENHGDVSTGGDTFPKISYYAKGHTVTWDLGEQPAGINADGTLNDAGAGTVTLVAEVLESAAPVGFVDNTAFVQVGNDPVQQTKTIENPTPQIDKSETAPGEGMQVMPDDELEYEIAWRNYRSEPADVVVTDKLDPGVDFVSAGADGTVLHAADTADTAASADGKLSINYNSANHIVTWTLKGRDAGAEGKVKLTVKVNENAEKFWSYDNPDAGADPNQNDDRVRNQAGVKVDNDPEVKTHIVENPTKPQKTETDINDRTVQKHDIEERFDENNNSIFECPEVYVGDQITYRITWQNNAKDESGQPTKAVVTITDKLDDGVDFISAEGGTYNYDKTTRTVTWNLGEREPRERGIVTLIVQVNQNAVPNGKVQNQAAVTVGNQTQNTNIVENPISEDSQLIVHKTVVGTDGDTEKEFHFTVTLDPVPQDGTYGEMVFVNGQAKFTLKHDQMKTAVGLPANTKYVVAETEANQDGYTTTVTNGQGELPASGTAEAEFVNSNGELPPSENIPDKVEITPGEGQPVMTGSFIDYEITWKNYKAEPADVIITDKLDPGVDFTSAGVYTTILNAGTASVTSDDQTLIISYDGNSHTVTWTLKNRDAGSDGAVKLRVQVNQKADKFWSYDDPAADVDPAREDKRVRNQAGVKVGNDNEVKTHIVENPTGPYKTETRVNDTDVSRDLIADEDGYAGPEVFVGDRITYTITWQNDEVNAEGTPVPATVTITDALDKGVTFISADNGGVYDEAIHTVTWALGEQPARQTGMVTLVVQVKEDAVPNGKVENQARITVNNRSVDTDIIENPIWQPHKTEPYPGDGKQVMLGQEITYHVTWKNYTTQRAQVVVRDPLDAGVDYVEGSAKAYLGDDAETAVEVPNAMISYGDHTVIWNLGEQEAGASGYVTFKVRVNETGQAQELVQNQAGVTVGNNPEQKTEIVENPTKPHKTEPDPGDGEKVSVGNIITYQVTWQNTEDQPATVIITDPLDEGLDYVEGSASDNGQYDTASHTITWTLENRAAYESNFVSFQARVNQKALEKDKVENQAGVQVGNNPKQLTNIVENPVWKPEKTEPDPGDGRQVRVGQEITYSVTWKNYREEKAAVTVTDTLDPGVDYVPGSASDGGLYDVATRTVTWNLGEKNPGEEGSVSFKVTVNQTGVTQGEVLNQAGVQVGDDPKMMTNVVQNPTKPKKIEVAPGDGERVNAGNEITYEVTWQNTEQQPAAITITDTLDPGLDYVKGSASDGGTYDANTRTITWVLRNRAAGEAGKVSFKAVVNETAAAQGEVENQAEVQVGNNPKQQTNIVKNPTGGPKKTETYPGDGQQVMLGQEIGYAVSWQNYKSEAAAVTVTDTLDPGLNYVDGSASDGGTYDPNTRTITWVLQNREAGSEGSVTFKATVNETGIVQGIVKNQAGVKIGDDPEVKTNIVENPTKPMKKELTPGNGQQVTQGDKITYAITWQNYKSEPASVVIKDTLDTGLDFISADNNGKYDAGTRTVTWVLENRKALESGQVSLTVQVNAAALPKGHVQNQASVKVGNDPEVLTNIVDNPTPSSSASNSPSPNSSSNNPNSADKKQTTAASSKTDKSPYTGDDSSLMLWLTLLILSVWGIGIWIFRWRRKSK